MNNIFNRTIQRAAMLLLVMLLTTTTARAEEVDAMYIGADGNPYSVRATVVTNSMNTIGISMETTWYVVNSNVTRNGEIDFLGDVHLILADGCTLTVDGNTNDYAMQGDINSTLTIYGQSGGTGKLSTTGKRGLHAASDLVVYGGTIEATATSSDYYAISSEHKVIVKDGTVTTTGTSNKGGILGQTGVEISGGKVTATGGTYGISTQGNHAITLGWTHATDFIKAKNYHVESGSVSITADQTLLIDDNPAQLVSGTVSNLSVIDGKKLTPDYSSDFTKDSDTKYTIHTAKGWDVFCDALQDNTTYNRFIGKTVKLDADYIEVTRMAGSPYHDFCGTFDGQKNMIFVNYGSAGEIVDENNAAPFRNVEDGCVIENLHVNGNIFTYKKYAGGLVGTQYGEVTIRNCWVSTVINSYTPGDGTHGGIVGHAGNSSNTKLTIKGCLFDGQLTTYGSTPTTDCGGFVGYKHDAGTVSITNSLYAPFDGDYDWEVASGATFVRNGSAGANCYYTRALGTAQGKQPRTVSGGENVSVEVSPIGNATATYDVSSITAYANGIMYYDTFYYGEGDQVSLTLSNTATAPLGYQYSGYSVSGGATLADGVLTMGNSDVTVSVDTSHPRSTGQAVSVGYVLASGNAHEAQAIALDGSETSLDAGTYFVGLPEVLFDHTLTLDGDVTLILADGCEMTVGSSGDRINGDGIKGYDFEHSTGYNLTITSQSLGAYMGTLSVYTSGDNNYGITAKALTINGGDITATGTDGVDAIALASYSDATINGGNVTATGEEAFALASNSNITINGGNVTATGTGSAYGISARGNITINGGTVNATNDNDGFGICAGNNVNINGGNVTISGDDGGVLALNGDITLGWTNATDRIYASSYTAENGTVKVADGKMLYADGNLYCGTITTPSVLKGKTLQPCIAMADNASNTDIITAQTGNTIAVALQGRTLYKDGAWNTLCLPFDVTLAGSPLEGATVMKLIPKTSNLTDGTLTLNFEDETTTMTAGTPYIIKWTKADGYDAANPATRDLQDPVFTAVTISKTVNNVTSVDGKVTFVGSFSPVNFEANDQSILFLGAENKLYWPNANMTLGACRAHFELSDGAGVREFKLNFGEGETTAVANSQLSTLHSQLSEWYTLDGVKLDKMPTRKGVYIMNGRKVVIK